MKKMIFKGIMWLAVLFGIFQFYASHFYSDEKLKAVAVQKIEMYYQLADNTLTYEEKENVAKSTLSGDMGLILLELNKGPKWELVRVEAGDVRRNYYEYDMVVEIEEGIHGEIQKNSYRFNFSKGMLGFKINGIHRLT